MTAFPVVNPATGETVRTFPARPRTEAHGIVEATHRAFLAWRQIDVSTRARHLRAAAGVFRARQGELTALLTEEMGCEEELFGPVASIIPVADEAEAIRVANDTAFGLGAAVFTRDTARGERIAAQALDAGAAFANASVRCLSAAPRTAATGGNFPGTASWSLSTSRPCWSGADQWTLI